MKILLTGANGYIGKRLLPVLLNEGHQVVCLVRDQSRFHHPPSDAKNISVIEADLLDAKSLERLPKEIDCAYYLVHSMSSSSNYETLEKESAINFRNYANRASIKHVVYLSGIINQKELSKHLQSRKSVELELNQGQYNFTSIRAGIIIGSGSASFEIIRDLVEKLPVMIAPKWLNTKCQPVSIGDVLKVLSRIALNKQTYNLNFDIGGPDILTYKEMLLEVARVRGLKRKIGIVPIMTPRLSSYWLYFVTSTSYKLAISLVNSMKIEVICRNLRLLEILNIIPTPYTDAVQLAFQKMAQNMVISSWKDSYISSNGKLKIEEHVQVPTFGTYKDQQTQQIIDQTKTLSNIWSIGGETGWYYADSLWKLRGFLDKMVGGVGLRRGRTNKNELRVGDALDFWRVLYANKEKGQLILYAEMKLPGEAWLEFNLNNNTLTLTATFRPKGVLGRLYWYMIYPIHGIIFTGLLRNIN